METTIGPPRRARTPFKNGVRKITCYNDDGSKRVYYEAQPYQRDLQGHVRRVSVYAKRRSDLKAKIRDIESRKIASFDSMKESLEAYLDRWLTRRAGWKKWALRTSESRKGTINKHIKPHLGPVRLTDIKHTHVRELLMSKLASIGSRTKLEVFKVLHAAFEDAIDDDLISANPCNRKLRPEHRSKEARPLTQSESHQLLTAASDHPHKEAIQIALTTGMREGEVLGLQWPDIDFDAGLLTVRATLTRDENGALVRKEPKTKNTHRVVLCRAVLDALRARQVTQRPASAWVFADRSGQPLRKASFLRTIFRPLLAKAELPATVRFHDLRHTLGSLAQMDGLPTKVIQERLGHSSAKMTLDTYTHTSIRDHAAAADRIAEIFGLGSANSGTKAVRGDSNTSVESLKPL